MNDNAGDASGAAHQGIPYVGVFGLTEAGWTVTLVRTIGGSPGVAALGAVFAHRPNGVLSDRLGATAEQRPARGGELTSALLGAGRTPSVPPSSRRSPAG